MMERFCFTRLEPWLRWHHVELPWQRWVFVLCLFRYTQTHRYLHYTSLLPLMTTRSPHTIRICPSDPHAYVKRRIERSKQLAITAKCPSTAHTPLKLVDVLGSDLLDAFSLVCGRIRSSIKSVSAVSCRPVCLSRSPSSLSSTGNPGQAMITLPERSFQFYHCIRHHPLYCEDREVSDLRADLM